MRRTSKRAAEPGTPESASRSASMTRGSLPLGQYTHQWERGWAQPMHSLKRQQPHTISVRGCASDDQAETAISHSYTVSSDDPVVCTGSVNAISRAASRLSARIT